MVPPLPASPLCPNSQAPANSADLIAKSSSQYSFYMSEAFC